MAISLQRLIIAILVLLSMWPPLTAAAGGNIVVTVDTANVRQGESFVLSFETDGVDGEPDFTPLKTDFDIVANSQRTNINIVDGRMQKSTLWQLKLVARRSGEIPIPSIAFGSARSEALTLAVAPAGGGADASGGPAIQLDVRATPEQPYVQAQVLLNVRLVIPEGIDLVDWSIGDPRVSGGDALITLLGKPRERIGTDKGGRARIIERTFAIFPQQHGTLTIEPLTFDGQVFEGAASLDDPFSQSIRTVRLTSEPVKLEVKPVPAAFKGRHWLPASSVELVENWSEQPDVLKAGEPITRSVSLLARGVTAGQLPELDAINDPHLRSYPEQPTLDDQGRSDGVIGLRMEKHALIAQQNGEVTLPEIRIPWWNTRTDRPEEAVIPARTLRVEGGATAPPAQPTQATQQKGVGDATGAVAPEASADKPRSPNHWPWLAAALGIGWAATAVAWWRSTRRRRDDHAPAEFATPSARLNAAAARVLAAARRHDAAETRRQLLAWADAALLQPATLESIATRFPTLAPELAALERSLYAGAAAPAWRGDVLATLFAETRPTTPTPAKRPAAVLAPLHPEAAT